MSSLIVIVIGVAVMIALYKWNGFSKLTTTSFHSEASDRSESKFRSSLHDFTAARGSKKH